MESEFIIVTVKRNVKRKIFIDDILYCKAYNTSTKIPLQNNDSHLISKPLKEIQQELPKHSFYRINRSYLINMNYAVEFRKNGHASIEMLGGSVLKISKKQKKHIEESFLKQKEVYTPIEKSHSHTEKGVFTK